MMEPTIHLRQAKAGDIPAILEIEQECFQEDSFSREQFVYLICRSKGTFYVVVEQERIIAYVSLLFHAGTRYLRIYSIAVHPDCRGRKLGQLLMERTIETALDCRAGKDYARSKRVEYACHQAIYEKWLYSRGSKAKLLS